MAALDLCSEGEVSGIVVTKHHTVEVLPLRLSLTDFAVETITSRVNNLHLIRRIREGKDTEDSERTNSSSKHEKDKKHNAKTTIQNSRVLEIAVFLDITAYKR